MTVVELFITTILRVLNKQEENGLICGMSLTEKQRITAETDEMDAIIDGDISNVFKTIIKINLKYLKI